MTYESMFLQGAVELGIHQHRLFIGEQPGQRYLRYLVSSLPNLQC